MKYLRPFIPTLILFNMLIIEHRIYSQQKSSDYYRKILDIVDKSSAHIASIKTLKSRIIETLEIRGTVKRYAGVYTAGGEGRFKVYFIEPYEQLIISTGKGLFWYIPDEKKVWTLEMPKEEDIEELKKAKGGILSFEPETFSIMKEEKEKFDFELKEQNSLFGLGAGHYLIVMIPKKGEVDLDFSRVELKVEKKNYTLRKASIYDLTGELKVSEEFRRYREYMKNLFFPCETEISIKTPSGVQRIRTIYIDPEINLPLKDGIFSFKIPDGVETLPLLPQRGFNK